MKQKQILLILSIVFLTILRGTWRKLPKYSKSLTYVSLVNIIYYYLCRRHLLWEFMPIGINWNILRVFHVVIVTPLLVLLFLSEFPKGLIKQIKHLTTYVLVSSIVEYFLNQKKFIQYKHGWNIFWSSLIYMKMYLYSYLVIKRPVLTSVLTSFSVIYFIKKFNIPINTKHKFSRRYDRLVDYFYHSFLEDLI